jgi:hypothetical protein
LDAKSPRRSRRHTSRASFIAIEPDSRSIGFSASRQIKRLDISGGVPFALAEAFGTGGGSWNADGVILFAATSDIYRIDASGEGKPVKVLHYGQFSPDGRWVAFETDESGRPEVVVQPFPQPFARWPISTGGGWWPRWSADGKELYFVLDGKMMASSIHASGSSFEAETPRVLFQVQIESGSPGGGHPAYAVSRDGRLLVNQFTEATSDNPITLILNWKPKSH